VSVKIYDQGGLMPNQEALVRMVRPGCGVLEVGCATGYMTAVLKERLGCRVTAVEINEETAAQAARYAEKMVIGDICRPETRRQIDAKFDCVIFADVLEHLADPWEVLRWAQELLTDGGCVLASVPNIANYRIRLKLLLGRWDYTPFGILDDSHLRFFTMKTARSLFTESGYDVKEMVCTNFRPAERAMMGLFPNAFAIQFVLKAEQR